MQVFFGVLNQQSFEGRYPKRIFTDVRDIPNLPCAKCGKKMLQRQTADNFLSSIRPALSTCLKKLPQLKESKYYYLLESIAQSFPKENIDTILSHGKVEEIKKIPIYMINVLKRITYNAPFVIKRLQKYKKYMSDTKLELMDIMEVYAKKYPDKTFEEIFELPKVYGYHKQRLAMEKSLLEVEAQKSFAKMEKIAARYGQECLLELKYLNLEVVRIVINRSEQDDTPQIIGQMYEDFLLKITDKTDNKNFRQHIKELPTANLTPDRIIVRLADTGSPIGVIYHLFSRINTFEHIIPKSKRGENSKHNGICMCAECNEKRGTLPYTAEFQMFPEFGKNIQKQLSTVMRYILHGNLLYYDTYPQEVKKTLYEQSGHTYKLNIKKYTEAQIEKSEEIIKEKKEQIRDASQKLYNVNREFERLINKQNKLKNECTKSYKILEQEKNKLEKFRQSLKEDLDAATEVHE